MLRNLEVSTVMVVGFEQKPLKMLKHVAELRACDGDERGGRSKTAENA